MTTPDTSWMQEIEERLDRGAERMRRIEDDLARNTEITTEVRDLLDVAKGGLRALSSLGTVAWWCGRIAAAGVALWGALYAITHGGRPPGGA